MIKKLLLLVLLLIPCILQAQWATEEEAFAAGERIRKMSEAFGKGLTANGTKPFHVTSQSAPTVNVYPVPQSYPYPAATFVLPNTRIHPFQKAYPYSGYYNKPYGR